MVCESTTTSVLWVRAAGRPVSGRPVCDHFADGDAVVRTVARGMAMAAGAGVVVILLGPPGYVVYCAVVMGVAGLLTKRAFDRSRGLGDHSGPAGPAPGASGVVAVPVIGTGEVTRPVSEPSLVGWSDEELCWAWRRSYAQLVSTTDAEVVSRLAEQRHGYLRELERRHPARFAAWMTSGARAAGDPTRFIRPHRTP